MQLSNVKVNWAIVQKTDSDGNWRIDAYPSKKDLAILKKKGVNIKTDDDGVEYISCKRKSQSNAGKDISPPFVVDASNQVYKGLIGNGSTCNISMSFYEWEYMKKTGVSCWLEAVQVLDLVEFNPSPFEAVGDGIKSDDLPF